MKYAAISLQGKQYLVSEDQELTVDRMPYAENETVEISDVLLFVDDKTKKVGAPTVEKAKVKMKVVKHLRGEKIRVATYKAKSRLRKVHGHRQEQTTVKIESITA